MSNHRTYSLWILFEGDTEPRPFRDLSFDTKRDADLSDLANHLQGSVRLAGVPATEISFLTYDDRYKRLPHDTMLKDVEQSTSASKPLVLRYPLSDKLSKSFSLAQITYAPTVCLSHYLFF
jgi:hypothetical protein